MDEEKNEGLRRKEASCWYPFGAVFDTLRRPYVVYIRTSHFVYGVNRDPGGYDPCVSTPFVGYYSYIYARCFSASIWAAHFEEEPLAPGAGERFRKDLLEPGGAVEPEALLRRLLGTGEAFSFRVLGSGFRF